MRDVPLREAAAPFRELEEEGVAAVVHPAFIERVAHLVALRGTRAAEGVVPAAGVGGDREHDAALAGDEARAGREIDAALLADRVLRAVAVARIACAEEERVSGLVALQIDDAQGLALLDLVHPAVAGGQHLVEDRILGIEGAFGVDERAHCAAK